MRDQQAQMQSPGLSGSARQVRCVLLCPPAVELPQRLLRGLSLRRVEVLVLTDAPAVLRELALGLTHVVVLVEPGRLAWREELIEAVRTYYPRVALWCYTAAGGEGLTPVNGKRRPAPHSPSAAASPARPPRSSARAASAAAPASAMACEPATDQQSAATAAGQSAASATAGQYDFKDLLTPVARDSHVEPEPLLSEEELTLLLRPYDVDPAT